MTDKIARLVPPPTVAQMTREATIRVLQAALDRCAKGDVDECLVILKHPGAGDWTVIASETPNVAEWIGKIEVVKFEWQMHAYLREQEEQE